MLKAVELESPELILHLGDYDRDCGAVELAYPEIPLRSVRGNCDRSSANLNVDEFTFGGKRFYMTHGHLFGVKTSLASIVDTAASKCADVLLFGHTHEPHYSVYDGISVINPGSIGAGTRSYAILELKDGAVTCEIKRVAPESR